jgi:hypothetical protein
MAVMQAQNLPVYFTFWNENASERNWPQLTAAARYPAAKIKKEINTTIIFLF